MCGRHCWQEKSRNPTWWTDGIAPILSHERVYTWHWRGGNKKAKSCWTHVCAAPVRHDLEPLEARGAFRQKNHRLMQDMCLQASRPGRNANTQVLHLVMLLPFCEVVLRCAVAIGHVDIIHLTSGVSSSQKCQDPGESPGHASSLLL